MCDDPRLDQAVASAIRHGLLPRRFPVRRDIELAGAVASPQGHTAFFDSFWPDARVLVLTAVNVAGGSVEAGLKAAALRELMRAVLHNVVRPAEALDIICRYSDARQADIAIARVDFAGHRLETAVCGRGKADPPVATLEPGALLWLRAGEIPALVAADAASSVQDRVASAIAASLYGAGCALLVKAETRDAPRATFSLLNEQLEIPRLIGEVRRHAEQHGVPQPIFDMLDIALDEVLSNCVNYGFRDSALHEIIVEVEVEPGRLTIEIRDDGVPFDPLGVPEPDLEASLEDRQIGGLGMHFVRTLLDDVTYRRSRGWNVLRLTKEWQRADDGAME